MGKIKTIEVIVRGNIVENNIILKLANVLKYSNLRADFSSSVAVPPVVMAVEKHYPSLAVFYASVDIEDIFTFRSIVEKLCQQYQCEIISYNEL